jgi:hypothetical protein
VRAVSALTAVLVLAATLVIAIRAVAARAGFPLAGASPVAATQALAARRHTTHRVAARPLLARSASGDGWRMAIERHYGPAHDASGYSAVVAPSQSDIWAFGGTNPGGTSSPVAVRLDGSHWRPWTLPAGLSGFISDASAPTRRDIWAVSDSASFVLHWNGTHWLVIRGWHRSGLVSGITALSPTNVWLFGTSAGGARGLGTWHFNGQSWARVTGSAGEIHVASAVSRRDIWAVAATRRGGFIEHFDGHSWRRADPGRRLDGATLDSVVALSHDNVWVVGNLTTRQGGEGRLVLAHLVGRRWYTTVTPWDADTGRLAADGEGGVWITADAVGVRTDALIGHLTPNEPATWDSVQYGLGSGITDIAVNSGTGAAWLTGGVLTRAGGNAAVWSRPGQRPITAVIGNLLKSDAAVTYRSSALTRLALSGRSPAIALSDPARGVLPGRRGQLLGQLVGGQPGLDPPQVADARSGLGLPRGQQRAAVLVGQGRDVQRADHAGLGDDLGLVQADQRPQDW